MQVSRRLKEALAKEQQTAMRLQEEVLTLKDRCRAQETDLQSRNKMCDLFRLSLTEAATRIST